MNAPISAETLLAELREVLAYPKLAKRLAVNGESVDGCLGRFLALAALTAARPLRAQ